MRRGIWWPVAATFIAPGLPNAWEAPSSPVARIAAAQPAPVGTATWLQDDWKGLMPWSGVTRGDLDGRCHWWGPPAYEGKEQVRLEEPYSGQHARLSERVEQMGPLATGGGPRPCCPRGP